MQYVFVELTDAERKEKVFVRLDRLVYFTSTAGDTLLPGNTLLHLEDGSNLLVTLPVAKLKEKLKGD